MCYLAQGRICIALTRNGQRPALSCRAPFPCDVDDDARWMLSGLATVFDQDAP